MKISVKKTKQIGLFTSIAIMISSVVGIGIFFKNGSIFRFNNFNEIGIIISWVVASLIAFFTALSFAYITFSKKSGSGIAGIIDELKAPKCARFISVLQTFFYNGILMPSISFFAAESLLMTIIPKNSSSPQIYQIFILAIGLFLFFLLLNFISFKFSSILQNIATIIKFIPIIAIAIIGITYGINNAQNSLFNHNNPKHANFSLLGILASLPSILFSFDSFLGISSLQHKIKNAQKNVPITLIVGMFLVAIVYILITIGQVFVGEGYAYGVINKVFKNNINLLKIITIIVNVFITISIIGVLNSFVIFSIHNAQYVINEKIIFWWSWIQRVQSKHFKEAQGLISVLFIFFTWITIFMIISIPLNTDAYIYLLSNYPIVFFFAVYGLIIAFAFYKKVKTKQKIKGIKKQYYTSDVTKRPKWFFNYQNSSLKNKNILNKELKIANNWILSVWIIGITSCLFVFLYQFLYGYTIYAWLDPYNLKLYTFGLFYANNVSVIPWIVSLLFFVMLIFFIGFPFLNDAILNLNHKKVNKQQKVFV